VNNQRPVGDDLEERLDRKVTDQVECERYKNR
jgi:hypothetical protein